MRYQRLTAVLAAWALLAAGCSLSQDAVTDSASDGTEAPSVPPTVAVSVPDDEGTEATDAAAEARDWSKAPPVTAWQHAYGVLLAAHPDESCRLIHLDEDDVPELIMKGTNEFLLYGFDGEDLYMGGRFDIGARTQDFEYRPFMNMVCTEQSTAAGEGPFDVVTVFQTEDGQIKLDRIVWSPGCADEGMTEEEARTVYGLTEDRRSELWRSGWVDAPSIPTEEERLCWANAPYEGQETDEAEAPYADAYRALIESEAYLDDAEWRDVPGDFLGTYLYDMPGRETPLLIVTDGGYNDVLFYGYDEGTDSAYLCEQVRTEQVRFTFRFRPETGDIGEQYGRIAGGSEYAIRCKNLDENVWYAFPSGDFLEGEAADEATTAAFDIVDSGTLPLFGDSWEIVGGDGGVPYDMLPYVEPFIIRR